eukprot:TRINITY_DN11297_c0_g8_i1.p4 TRINITY_DN11297_c0_g8~~TRINITY_DN11297_c0_g8_i1.p4  ORF type:complete len:116 (+),score=16.98 TRINITY_DN11297_c0_g8_i1:439-786(+)
MSSIGTFALFSIIFGILVARIEQINYRIMIFTSKGLAPIQPFGPINTFDGLIMKCVYECHYEHEEKWTRRHIMGSWECFWSSSLICFILSAYTIAGSLYVYNTEPDTESEAKDKC